MMLNEKHFLKICEYGNLTVEEFCTWTSELLGLEFYSDKETYTVCSNGFLIDFTETSCGLIFVDESQNNKYTYLDKYFNRYLNEKHILYCLIRMFVTFEGCEKTEIQMIKEECLTKHKTFCECVLSGDYCIGGNIYCGNSDYNIYTHRKDVLYETPVFFVAAKSENLVSGKKTTNNGSEARGGKNIYEKSIMEKMKEWYGEKKYEQNEKASGEFLAKKKSDVLQYDEVGENLYEYFSSDIYTKDIFSRFSGKNCYYEGENILVKKNTVYINGKRSSIASFAFRKGSTLENSLKLHKYFEK